MVIKWAKQFSIKTVNKNPYRCGWIITNATTSPLERLDNDPLSFSINTIFITLPGNKSKNILIATHNLYEWRYMFYILPFTVKYLQYLYCY